MRVPDAADFSRGSCESIVADEQEVGVGHKLITLLIILISMCSYAQTRTVTITEPGIYEIGDLFKTPDVVVLVRIVSDDAENYSCAIYKGEIVQCAPRK